MRTVCALRVCSVDVWQVRGRAVLGAQSRHKGRAMRHFLEGLGADVPGRMYMHGVTEVGRRSGGGDESGGRTRPGGWNVLTNTTYRVCCASCARACGAQSAEEVEQHRVDRHLV